MTIPDAYSLSCRRGIGYGRSDLFPRHGISP
jgi:hypothetical protein